MNLKFKEEYGWMEESLSNYRLKQDGGNALPATPAAARQGRVPVDFGNR